MEHISAGTPVCDAGRLYKQLMRQLQQLQRGGRGFHLVVVTVDRCLDWPPLASTDQMILSILHGPILQAEKEGSISPDILEACIDGVALLLHHSTEPDILEWASRMKGVSGNMLVRWLDGKDVALLDDWAL